MAHCLSFIVIGMLTESRWSSFKIQIALKEFKWHQIPNHKNVEYHDWRMMNLNKLDVLFLWKERRIFYIWTVKVLIFLTHWDVTGNRTVSRRWYDRWRQIKWCNSKWSVILGFWYNWIIKFTYKTRLPYFNCPLYLCELISELIGFYLKVFLKMFKAEQLIQ